MSHSNAVKGNWESAVKTSASYNWRNSRPNSNCDSGPTFIRTVNAKGPQGRPRPVKAWVPKRNKFLFFHVQEHPLKNTVDRGIFDSGCSRHMTGNKDQLEDFEEFNGGSVTFGELGHFNLFSISQICDKQHKVLFTETECLVVSSDFKMPDENQILLKVPRHHNMYSFDMKTPSPAKGFACLIAKATSDESKLWHRRLGHINFKNLNKLVKGNLVRGLPSKVFKNDHTCVACHKGKQHRASCKAKLERLITEPLHTLHMDLFGPTSVKSINHASYCLVITDDCTRFSWVFFLASKDETSGILQNFIRQIENQLSHRVKIIRSDNGTEFKNRDMLEFCGNKGIKQEYSNARTPQQNGVAERMNRTLIEAARTMLADSLLPTTFWAEAVSTACYIFNRVILEAMAKHARRTTISHSKGYTTGVLLANNAPLTPITAPWPFHKWGIDIAGPFLEGSGKVKFFIVAMDYFMKWIEAKVVATITGTQVKKFVWDNIVCRFGLLGEIISDNGKQFSDNPFKDWCDKLNITQQFASVKHPQSNGLVERANRSLGEGIKVRLGEGNKNWVEELPHVLWAHRTMIKSSHGDTPFSLTYGTEAVIPVEIRMPTYRTAAVDTVHNDEGLWLNLDLLEEKREHAAIREAKAKVKMTKYYNARVCDVAFRPEDFVYRSNDASHAAAGGKLGPKWEGPYEVTEALGDGAYKLRTRDGADLPRTWNIANLKKCYL
ncbi:reverse transcriptase domain-containing protein [Tanacetum coccineum]